MKPLAWWLGLTLAAGAVAAAISPQHLGDAARAYLLAAAGASCLAGLGRVARSMPREAPPRPRWVPVGRRPPEPQAHWQRLENALTFAGTSRFDLEMRLGPQMREIARDLLSGRRGISLEGEPERAREVLGPDLWELVRPGRETVAERSARGASREELERLVAALEAI